MLNRREFLKAAGVAALAPTACVTQSTKSGEWVDDIHSQLNRTFVSEIEHPKSVDELRQIIRSSKMPISVAGGRHSMGGQQFGANTTLIDIRAMNRVLSFDSQSGIVEVESGIEWPELMKEVVDRGAGRWGIAQKQTGADRLTLGGGMASNVHGRGLTMKPLVGDIESFVLIAPDGERIECSRSKNQELFSLAIGGYGLFGVIGSLRLRLTPRRKVERVVEVQDVEKVMSAFDRRIADGYMYGDFQFSIDEKSENYMRTGVFSCYRPVSDDTPMPAAQAELHPEDWLKLLVLGHVDKSQVYDRYVGYYLSTSGQVYWSDEHQLSYYPDNYHRTVDQVAQAKIPGSEMISEVYVPREQLADFLMEAREDFRRNNVNLIYGTVRLIERDGETFLAWAKQRYACIVVNLHVDHSPEGVNRAAESFRRLIDMAIRRTGSYYLTYHRWARRDQVEASYPRFEEFLRRKRQHDPRERLQSDWYRHYRAMFNA